MDVSVFYSSLSEQEKKVLRAIVFSEYEECLMLELSTIQGLLSGARGKVQVAEGEIDSLVTVGQVIRENRFLSKRLEGMLEKLNKEMKISELRNKSHFLTHRNVGLGTWTEFCELLKKYNIQSNGN